MTGSDRSDDRRFVGWDVGGTSSAAVLATADGDVLARRRWHSNAPAGPDAMIRDFLKAAEKLDVADAVGAGVSIGGPMDARTGTIKSPPHLPGWDGVPLADVLRDALGVPVVVEHDAAACLEAEWLWGAARGATHAVYLTCGTGCGAGVMVDGRILRGPAGQSPEAGHVRLAPDGPEMFGKRGCVESFCSGEGIARLAPWMFPDRFDRPVPTRELAALAADGDAPAQAVLDEAADRTGQLCSLLADLFSPQVIVLGSLARYLGEDWVGRIRAAFAAEALEVNAADTRIVPAGLGETLQDLSAVAPCVFRCDDNAQGAQIPV